MLRFRFQLIYRTFEKKNDVKVKDKVNSILFWNCKIKSGKMAEILENFQGVRNLEII